MLSLMQEGGYLSILIKSPQALEGSSKVNGYHSKLYFLQSGVLGVNQPWESRRKCFERNITGSNQIAYYQPQISCSFQCDQCIAKCITNPALMLESLAHMQLVHLYM